jgi:subtilisin-like proprotein convertase family protein
MRKIYTFFFIGILLLVATISSAQVSGYSFAQSNSTYTPITGGTLLGNTTSDDERFVDPALPLGGFTTTGVGFPIGFNFTYNGIVFDRFAVNNNGWISLGQSALTPSIDNNSTSAYTPLSSTATNTPALLRNRIAGMGRDLQAQAGSVLRFETTGSAPNRKLVVQYTNYKRFGTAGTGDNFNFQIILNETSNIVQVVYGTMVFNTTTTTSSINHVGLGGTTSTDFNNRQTTTPHDWNATTAGTTNALGCQNATSTIAVTAPLSGLTFSWTAPSCTAPPTLTANVTSGTTATISWSASGSATSYEWEIRTTGGCGSGSPIQSGSTAGTSVNLTGLTANTLYTYCVRSVCSGPVNSGWNSGTFSTIVNDDCSGAITINCGQTINATTTGALTDAVATCVTTLNTASGVWYKFVGDGLNSTLSLCGSGYDTKIGVFTGTCGGLVCVTGNDDFCGLQSQVSFPTVIGTTYYVLVTGFGTSSGNFTLTRSCASPLPNDLCSGAININCGQTITGNTTTATTDATATTCGTTLNTAPGVWYSFTGDGSNVTLSLCGSSYDTKIGVYSGSCGALVCVTGNDDFCGLQSQVAFPTVNGTTYYILVTGFASESGSFTLNRSCENPCAIIAQPVARVICQGASTTFNITAPQFNITYQWQLSTNLGGTWSNIAGATTNSTSVANALLSQSGNQYRCVINTPCGLDTSDAVTLTVTPNPTHQNLSATPNIVCAPGPVTFTGTAVGGTLSGGSDVAIASSGIINLAVPDNSTVSSNITVPAFSFTSASQLKVRLNITHTWVGDLAIRLTSPCGNTIVFDRPGVPPIFGNGNPLNGVYIFDIAAASVLPETGATPAGTYKPSDPNGASHNWVGLTFPCTAAGTWTLTLQDFAAPDPGNLIEWAILAPSAVGQYSHTLSGPGTIVQNPSTGGASNPTGNFTASNLSAGALTYNLTSTDSRGCSVTSPINVTVNPRPVPVVVPAVSNLCNGSSTQLMILDTTRVFNSTGGPITINDNSTATPYPSTITTSGLPATAQVLAVTLNGISHTFSSDIDILLQSPNGTNVVLMSDIGGGNALSNVNYTFRDGFPALGTGVNPSGTYQPTNTAGPDNFPAPGPVSFTQIAPTISLFNTASLTPNGTWNLLVVDDIGGDVGSITSWSITFSVPGAQTITYTWSSVPAGFNATGNPVTVSPTVNTTYSVNAVSNLGCASTTPGTATINVLALPAITVQPTPATQTICPGYNVVYTVTATGAGITYQWRKDGVNLANGPGISGVTTNTLTLTAVTAASAGTYTVVVSGTCPPAVTSNGAVLQIGTLPTISAQPPATTTVCERSTTSISVTATALPPLQIYQWQLSTDGGTTWNNLANTASTASPFYNNVFSATLTIGNAPLSINNNRYRCVITTNCGFSITSAASVLTVNATPTVTVVPVTARVCISDTLLLLSGSPTGGVWTGPGIVPGTSTFIPYNTSVGIQAVKYKVTNSPSGCADSAILSINVQECTERIRLLTSDGVLLYPNPNNGQFNIRVNSVLYNYLGMKVFTAAGALVKQQKWSNLPYGRVLPIDLRNLAAGVYMVYIFYEDGVRTSEKTYKVIIGSH